MLNTNESLVSSMSFRIAVCGVTFLLMFCGHSMSFFANLENRMYDLRIRLVAGSVDPSPEIVIVGIDDQSLQWVESAVGRWPWPRSLFAGIIDYCGTADAVATDIIFSEADSDTISDALYADQVRKHGSVVSAIFFGDHDTGSTVEIQTLERFALPGAADNGTILPEYPFSLTPFDALLDATAAVGHVNHTLDADSVLRSYSLASRHQGRAFPSLALAAAVQHVNGSGAEVAFRHGGVLAFGGRAFDVTPTGQLRIIPPEHDHRTYSAMTVLQSYHDELNGKTPRIARNAFDGKIVLIGSLATGLEKDMEVVAGGSGMEGVRITAIALDNLLSGRHMRVLSGIPTLILLAIFCCIALFPSRERPAVMIVAVILCIAIFAVVVLYMLVVHHVMVPVVSPLLGLVLSSSVLGAAYWYQELMQRRKLEFNLHDAYDELKEAHEKLEDYSRTLEDKVDHRTRELKVKNEKLEDALQQLKAAQEQLIIQEKMASLGQVTAGIAHEIKNPLNFVNNFSKLSIEISAELAMELDTQLDRIDPETLSYVKELLSDIQSNSEKIHHHGVRADRIVRSMLLQYRGQSEGKVATDINALLEENVNLAYHGKKAEDESFNLEIVKSFDSSVGEIEVLPQDLGRVFLNILNNACYAASEQKGKLGNGFAPSIHVSTLRNQNCIEIKIRDNGAGIPATIRDKIFDPFFTTKPTGKGTGLGLSICFDIITQRHRGEIMVNSEPGCFTEFIIKLPVD